MVAPRALVFRPLVKGNEESGNEIVENLFAGQVGACTQDCHTLTLSLINLLTTAVGSSKYKQRVKIYSDTTPKTSNKRFIIQLLWSIDLSMKEGESDSFACARRPVRQTGFLLYNMVAVYLYCYLDGIRCSWIIRPF